MKRLLVILAWAGIVLLGAANSVLEDVLLDTVLLPFLPASWDMTGYFFSFTLPLGVAFTFIITGGLALPLGLLRPARMAAYWLSWSVTRVWILNFFGNPWGDIVVYLAWIAALCGLVALVGRLIGGARDGVAANA